VTSSRVREVRSTPTYKHLFAAVVAPLAALVFCYQWASSVGPQMASGFWPTTEAVILECETYRKNRSTRLRLHYEYVVDGVTHRANRFEFNGLSGHWLFRSKWIFARDHTVGTKLTIAYDPAAPSSATVRSGISFHDLWPVPLFVAAFVWGSVVAVRELSRRRRQHVAKKKYGSWACPNCGYNRIGLDPGTPCPECADVSLVVPLHKHPL